MGPYYMHLPLKELASIKWALFVYGGVLLGIGVFAVVYHPVHGFAYNPHAMSALITGAVTSAITLLWAILFSRGFKWTVYAAMVTTAIFAVLFTWRATVAWLSVKAGNHDKWYPASLISAMLVSSLFMLGALIRYYFRKEKFKKDMEEASAAINPGKKEEKKKSS